MMPQFKASLTDHRNGFIIQTTDQLSQKLTFFFHISCLVMRYEELIIMKECTGLYCKSFTIVIYDRNDSTIILQVLQNYKL